MDSNKSAFQEFIYGSAEQYIHTVVLIDDRIYEPKGQIATTATKPPTRNRKLALGSATTASEKQKKTPEESEVPELPDEVSFHDVQNSFAKKRIVCSLYQPKKTASFSERSEVYSLCASADVVVVDWDLHGDPGTKATELVGNLVSHSIKDIPHQLRLILVYTMEVNLGDIANTLFEDLSRRLGEGEVDVNRETEGCVIKTSNARVVVLGKRTDTPLIQYRDYWVPEKELAKRTIREFSHLASGLLQAIVLRGMAHIRDNNRRILTRFHEGLDTAFLTHRALLLPDESFGQIVPLLTDELRAVLEDTLGERPLGDRAATENIVTDWCENSWKPFDNPPLKIGEGADALVLAKNILCNGPALEDDYLKFRGSNISGLIEGIEGGGPRWKESSKDKLLNLAKYLSGDRVDSSVHEKLSSLMSQRIAYDNTDKSLHLGVILKETSGDQRYMLCLQPVCDSVRMAGKPRAFIFCFMEIPAPDKRFTHVVLDLNDNPIKLYFKPKVSKIYVAIFSAESDAVCAQRDADGRFLFNDNDKKQYEWIAELKTEHAQRAAEEFGRVLSRVGLTESEWLRLKAK